MGRRPPRARYWRRAWTVPMWKANILILLVDFERTASVPEREKMTESTNIDPTPKEHYQVEWLHAGQEERRDKETRRRKGNNS